MTSQAEGGKARSRLCDAPQWEGGLGTLPVCSSRRHLLILSSDHSHLRWVGVGRGVDVSPSTDGARCQELHGESHAEG